METKVQRFNNRLGALRQERSSFIPHWTDIAKYTRPRSTRFLTTDRNNGNKRHQDIVDSTSIFASRTLSSGLMAGVTNPNRPWLSYRTMDPDLNKYHPVKVWLEDARNRTFEVLMASNIYTTLPGTYADLGDFATNAFALMEDDKDVIRCYPAPIGSYCLGLSDRGTVDTFYREYQMTAAQMVQRFGEANVSARVKDAFNGKGRDLWFDVVHVVEPNDEHDPAKIESRFKRFRSVYYEPGTTDDKLLSEKGYDDFPIMAPRWDVVGEDVYGSNCPGMDALGCIKGLQIENRRKAEGIDKIMRPTMNAPSTMRNGAASILPGGINFLDVMQGQQGFEPAYQVPPGFLGPLVEDIHDVRNQIKRAYYEDLFLLISSIDRTGVTAEEIASKKEEKLLMLGPAYLRINDELLEPVIDRVFNIMWKGGHLPPPPPELLREDGLDLSIEFTSTMAQALKLAGYGDIERAYRFVGSVGQAFPEALDNLDPDATVEEVFTRLGVPPKLLHDPKKRDAIRQGRAQAKQAEQSLAMAQQSAQTAQTLADTQVTDPSALQSMMQMVQGA